jgi:hypothetical protein
MADVQIYRLSREKMGSCRVPQIGGMQNLIKHLPLSAFLLSLVACSNRVTPVVSQQEDHLVSTSSASVKKAQEWREKFPSTKPIQKLQTQHLKSGKPMSTRLPSPSAETVAPSSSTALNSSTIFQPADLILPLSGREVVWSINPNNYIPRDVVDCPKNRIDSFCMGRDYKVIQKIFGPPTQETHYTWSYDKMNVKYLAGGGRHSIVHIGFLNGKVCRVTTAP